METKMDAVQIELTNKCQLDCAECPRRLMSRPIGEMDLELAKIICSDAVEFNSDVGFNLNGLGEPLLYNQLSELLIYLNGIMSEHTKIDIFTNLALPEKKIIDIFSVINSLNRNFLIATTKHIYDGKGNKEIPVSKFYDNNLQIVAEMTKDNPKIDLHAHVVITKYHTEAEIDDFFSQFRKILPHEKVHTTEKLNPWFDLVAEMAGCQGVYEGYPYLPTTGEEICLYPFKICHLGWDGEMIICCTDDVDQECSFGKVEKKGDLIKLWNGEKLSKIRDDFNLMFDRKIENAPRPCQKCHWLNWLKKETKTSLPVIS